MATRMETATGFPRAATSGRRVSAGLLAMFAAITIGVLAGAGTIGYLWGNGSGPASVTPHGGGVQAGVASATIAFGPMYAGLNEQALKDVGYTGRLGVAAASPFVPGSMGNRCIGGWSDCGSGSSLASMYGGLNEQALIRAGYTGRLGAVTHNHVVPGR